MPRLFILRHFPKRSLRLAGVAAALVTAVALRLLGISTAFAGWATSSAPWPGRRTRPSAV